MPSKRKTPTSRNIASPKRNVGTKRSAHGRSGYSAARGASTWGKRSGQAGSARAGRGARHSAQGGFSTTPASSSPFASGSSKHHVSEPSTRELLLTRRNLLIGAGAIGGAVVLGGAGSLISSQLSAGDTIESISVPTDAVTSLDNLSEATYSDHLRQTGNFELTYGTLVWVDDATYAACLVPTGSSSPLNQVGMLNLGTGGFATLLEQAEGQDEGFDVLDCRLTSSGLIWVEENIFEGQWRVYTASLSGAALDGVNKVDEGDSTWYMPSIAAAGSRAFWQLSPNTEGDAKAESSVLKTATFGSTDVSVAWTSKSAFATRVTSIGDGVVITPRAESTSTYYQLTRLSADDASATDQMTLPASMTPNMASFGKTGFSFAFSDIYSYGDGIANLGTYTPMTESPGDYNNIPWFRFSRTPSATPAWCGSWFMVKSTRAIAGVNFDSQSYFMVDAPSNTDDYGEYLVSSGQRDFVVGLSQITPTATSTTDEEGNVTTETEDSYALVRVFTCTD